MSRNPPQKQSRLDYKNDIQLSESTHFIAVANQYQRRSHLIIRARRDMENSISNNLEDFDEDTKTEFWHMVQQVVAETKKPSMLCHHYGGWRSAPHFHVHIVFKKRDFAEYVAKKANNMDDLQHIIDLISKKSEQLVKRHLEEYKRPEIEEIKNDRPEEFDEDHEPFRNEYGEYRVELDKDYPWIKFIRKVPPKYSQDPREIPIQLQRYRQECFSAMYSYANEVANLSSYRIWVKLAGDAFNLNQGRTEENKIFGVISVYTPDFYRLHSTVEAANKWLDRYERANPDVLACV